jgi:8-oxo-dGTP pyrophosphatase MutT (NUDIX family)
MATTEMSHFVCAIIWRMAEGGAEFLVLDSVSTDRHGRKSGRQVKFPGGMNRLPDESVMLTLQREVLEETHLALLPGSAKKVWEFQANPEHTKYGFLVPAFACQGELRSTPLRDNGDEMSSPYWVPASELGRVLFEKHQPAYLAACRELGIL